MGFLFLRAEFLSERLVLSLCRLNRDGGVMSNISATLSGGLAGAVTGGMIYGGVIKGTLDMLNSDPYSYGSSGKNMDYQFQTTVLNAAYSAKGAAFNSII